MTLAQRLMAHPRCPGWQPGMRVLPGWPEDVALRLVSVHLNVDNERLGLGYEDGARLVEQASYWTEAGDEPDLTDPATAGVVLGWLLNVALVEVVGQKGAVVVGLVAREESCQAPTLGEAAALACLAVWGEP